MTIKQVRLEKPSAGWMKLNTDRASNNVLGAAGEGGLIRDDKGNWVRGFSRKLGKVNSFMAEIWALRDGLLLCHQLKLDVVIIELDAKALVDALNNPMYANSVISPLFDDCRVLMARLPRFCIRHIYREANKCVNWLANISILQTLDFVMHSCPLVDLLSFVEVDCLGLYSSRLCPEPLFSS